MSEIEETKTSTSPNYLYLELELGDIIQLNAPSNIDLNDKIFLINYIDKKLLKLIDVETLNTFSLYVDEQGDSFTDKSITGIAIINKSPEKGYARQNQLLPNTWINITFGGDLPIIITGKITDLEEDSIEIKTYPENETIYINFDYKGIPLELPIISIVIRNPPEKSQDALKKIATGTQLSSKDDEGVIYTDEGLRREGDVVDDDVDADGIADDVDSPDTDEDTLTLKLPVETVQVREKLAQVLSEADEIIFGEDIGSITQEIEVSEDKKRFNIDVQVNDLLDDLLSTIPNKDRTQRVMNKLHTIVTRFKQLRDVSSLKNKNGEIIDTIKKGSDYKPLTEKLNKLNKSIMWLIPVVKNSKKIYNGQLVETPDIINIELSDDIEKEYELNKQLESNSIPSGQNKYDYYINALSKLYTPYNIPTSTEDILIETNVNANYDVIVNNLIENTQELYSSVISNNLLRTKRFVINRYDLGLNRLQSDKIKEGFMDAEIQTLTNNDKIAIDSFLTLPEPFVRYSHINLPSTNIYDKTNLNHVPLSYWNILRKATSLTTIIIDEDFTDYSEETYLKDTTHIITNKTSDIYNSLTPEETYKKFIDLSIPKTRVLFNLIKKYIPSGTSYIKILSYLEPFYIYKEDISFKQYEEIYKYMLDNIDDLRIKMTQNEKYTALIKQLPASIIISSLLLGVEKYKETVTKGYDIETFMSSNKTSDSELLTTIMKTDNGKYFNILMSLLNNSLHSEVDVEDKIQETLKDLDDSIDNTDLTDESKKCKSYVLTKHYTNVDDIEYDDTQLEIYFDKKYDQTQYDIIKEYELEQSTMDKEEFKDFLVRKLQENIGLNKEDAILDAEAMILGKRLVREGNYAILYDPDIDSIKNKKYFKYENGKWEYDDSITQTVVGDSNDNSTPETEINMANQEKQLFCNITEKCINLNDNVKTTDIECDSLEKKEQHILKNTFEKLTSQIMDDYIEDNDGLKNQLEKIREQLNYELERVRSYNYNKLINNNNSLYIQGVDVGQNSIIVSPYSKLRDLILAESDLYNKMNYITMFIKNITRPSREEDGESPYWFYCNTTNVKLLPTFYEQLAFGLYSNTYIETIETICKERGEISDDGDKWVDKHSGYTITMIEFSVEEGYDEAGYKIQTNDVLLDDIGASYKLKASASDKKDVLTSASDEAVMINKVVNALSRYSGINLGDNLPYVIKSVEEKLLKELPNKEVYQNKVKMAEQLNKKMASYEENKNKLLLLYTGLYFLIAIQTAVPILKTKKTMEGCSKSFSGYPLENTVDFSGLKYIACIMKKISSSNKPWNTIHKTRIQTIEKTMITIYDKTLSNDVEIQNKFKARELYLSEHKDIDIIPDIHNVSKWTTFLPPLSELSGIKETRNITQDFKDTFIQNMKSGNKQQIEQLSTIKSKILLFSLGIQNVIQKIVKKEVPLLQTLTGIPFVENFCCSINDDISTFNYFNKKDKSITDYNNVVKELSNMYNSVIELSKSPTLLYSKDTKLKYPDLRTDFSEETVYRAFIHYCKINKSIPINDSLRPLCIDNKSNFDPTDSIETKIKIMKEEGKIYNSDMLKQLIDIINKENIIQLDIENSVYSSKQILQDILNNFDKDDSDINPLLRDKLSNLLTTFENVFEIQTDEMKDLRNFLLRANGVMKKNIFSFLKKFGLMSSSEERNIESFLNTFIDFKEIDKSNLLSSKDETSVYSTNYVKIIIKQMCVVFPNIIINDVDHEKMKIPKHWGFSKVHNTDITNFIKKSYQDLKGHKSDTMKQLLIDIQTRTKDMLILLDNTPFLSSPAINSKKYFSIFNNTIIKELYTFYFLYILESYIDMQNININKSDKASQGVLDIEERSGLDIYEDDLSNKENINMEADTSLEDAYELEKIDSFNINKSIASLLISYIKIFSSHKNKINYNRDSLYDLVLRVNEYEKETKRRYLKSLTVEERKVDSELRKAKMGQWSVGLEEGVTKYNPDFYDKERKQMEKEALEDIKFGYNTEVTDMNRDILSYELMLERTNDQELDSEAYDMSGLPDDDDYGDRDGDEAFY